MRNRRRVAHLASLLVCAFLGRAALAQPVQWPVSSGGNGHYYERVLTPLTWAAAKLAAEGRVHNGLPGRLVTITSAAENEFVYQSVWQGIEQLWLGAFQPAGSPEPGGGWQWITGEPWQYTHWGAPEPNNYGGNENCLETAHPSSGPDTWNDINGSLTRPGYIVEYSSDGAPCNAWQPLAGGADGHVLALTEYNDDLIAGGIFTTAGAVAANRVARWNGTTWQPLGAGLNGPVRALAVYNGELIAAGQFTMSGSVPVNYIARWNGSNWHAVGSGMGDWVQALTVFNGELIAGGHFTTAGGVTANRIARWNGTIWRPLASGMDAWVGALTVYNGALIAGGQFSSAGVPAAHIARWNGSQWSALGNAFIGGTGVWALAVYNGELIAGGDFGSVGGCIARWNGTSWQGLGSGIGSTGNSTTVYSLATYNGELIAGGNALVGFSFVARWNGAIWQSLGAGANSIVFALRARSNALVAGGFFTITDGISANYIARWYGCATGAADQFALIDANRAGGSGLIVNGNITSNWQTLANVTNPLAVEGIAADGVTRVIVKRTVSGPGAIVFYVTDENGGSADVGTLSTPGENQDVVSLPVQATFINNQWMAFAVLKAPMDFARGPNDDDEGHRNMVINSTFTPSGGGSPVPVSRTLAVRRPPVLLMHGLASDPSTFQWALWSGINQPNDHRFVTFAFAYNSMIRINDNIPRVRDAVAMAVQQMRVQGIAATQADVVGHSLGGLLSRLFVSSAEGGGYIRNDNFGAGDIHKLITVDTPHQGSPWANNLVTHSSSAPTVLGIIFGPILKHCVTCGAVADLRTDSDRFKHLPAANLRVHAIVGVGGTTTLGLAGTGALTFPGPLGLLVAGVLGFGRTLILGQDQHDIIVPLTSQKGLLESPHITSFDFQSPFWENGLHTFGVTRDNRVNSRVIELLNFRTTNSAFANGFPEFNSGEAASAASPPGAPSVGLSITQPLPGAVFSPGQQIVVSAEPINGFVPERVVFGSSHTGVLDEEPPFEASLQIPADALGPTTLLAYGFDAKGTLAQAEPVVVEVTTTATITAILLTPQPVYLFEFAPTAQISVTGIYSDGVQRNITDGFGVTYSTLDANIATVSADGVVNSEHIGTTTVTATVNGVSASASVNVLAMPCPADVTDDGSVGVADLLAVITAWGPCIPGPAGCPADIAPSPPNGVVGVEDLLAVIVNWGSCPQ